MQNANRSETVLPSTYVPGWEEDIQLVEQHERYQNRVAENQRQTDASPQLVLGNVDHDVQ